MDADEFLRQLPQVPKDELSSDICMICLHPYGSTGSDEELSEVAVRLPCDHVMGLGCISTWLSQEHGERKRTCPYCRRKLFNAPRAGSLSTLRASVGTSIESVMSSQADRGEALSRLPPRSEWRPENGEHRSRARQPTEATDRQAETSYADRARQIIETTVRIREDWGTSHTLGSDRQPPTQGMGRTTQVTGAQSLVTSNTGQETESSPRDPDPLHREVSTSANQRAHPYFWSPPGSPTRTPLHQTQPSYDPLHNFAHRTPTQPLNTTIWRDIHTHQATHTTFNPAHEELGHPGGRIARGIWSVHSNRPSVPPPPPPPVLYSTRNGDGFHQFPESNLRTLRQTPRTRASRSGSTGQPRI